MLNVVLLLAGTALSLLFAIFYFAGGKYAEMTENLSGGLEYPLKSLYVVGYVWESKLLKLSDKNYQRLREEASILYGQYYRDYYAHLVWAQTLTLVHLALAVMLVVAGMSKSNDTPLAIMVAAGLVSGIIYQFFGAMKHQLKKRSDECMIELPNMITKLALLTGSGMILRDAWIYVAKSKTGVLYELMQTACDEMENGVAEVDALRNFGINCNVHLMKKFSSAMVQSIEKGGNDLILFLTEQSTEMWDHKKQLLLQKGEAAASKLIGPIGLMFGGILLIVISGAMSSMGGFGGF
jgi:tight adherence protein C